MYYSYEQSKEYLKKFNLKSSTMFYSMAKSGSFIKEINKRPYEYFSAKNRNTWISWEDFLSFSKSEQKKDFLSYEDSLNIVKKLGIKNWKDWCNKYKELNLKSLKIPSNPDKVYKDKGWVSYSNWLGLSNYKNFSNIKYLSYEDCKSYIKNNFPEIVNKGSWVKLDKSTLPIEVPKRPDYIYKDKGWVSWEAFLDSKLSPLSKSKLLMDFKSAREYVRKLKFKDQYEYYNYITTNNITFLPKRPDSAYSKKWKGYLDFLGCVSNRESIGERLIKTYLDDKNISYQREKKFKSCVNIKELPFDFYLPDYNVCIEYDGELHYRSSSIFGGDIALKRIKINDDIKTNWCIVNNIKLLRIHYLKKSKINKILDDFFLSL